MKFMNKEVKLWDLSQNKILKPGSNFECLYVNYSLGVRVSCIK